MKFLITILLCVALSGCGSNEGGMGQEPSGSQDASTSESSEQRVNVLTPELAEQRVLGCDRQLLFCLVRALSDLQKSRSDFSDRMVFQEYLVSKFIIQVNDGVCLIQRKSQI